MSGPFYDLSVTELMAYDITWDMSTTEERHQLEEQIKAEDPKKWEEFKREMIRIYGSLEY
ncbi:hypothetical protein BK798_04080 [Methanobrevibacter smithii]|jgi:hypothetical protein|uniref:Uncharacterized protein n=1 Tax=Methanobrevibacter smithii TaxID=2173 RepID=A0A2H4U6E1_METSM|nr:hypothetical protein [Methanobrevibacter smithii]ATZ59654.1 hypothetical protein BK798_04080 [Methanobrevibacter smithii]HJJ02134.1 hypothetical protein [Methanobrevibacter smithii]